MQYCRCANSSRVRFHLTGAYSCTDSLLRLILPQPCCTAVEFTYKETASRLKRRRNKRQRCSELVPPRRLRVVHDATPNPKKDREEVEGATTVADNFVHRKVPQQNQEKDSLASIYKQARPTHLFDLLVLAGKLVLRLHHHKKHFGWWMARVNSTRDEGSPRNKTRNGGRKKHASTSTRSGNAAPRVTQHDRTGPPLHQMHHHHHRHSAGPPPRPPRWHPSPKGRQALQQGVGALHPVSPSPSVRDPFLYTIHHPHQHSTGPPPRWHPSPLTACFAASASLRRLIISSSWSFVPSCTCKTAAVQAVPRPERKPEAQARVKINVESGMVGGTNRIGVFEPRRSGWSRWQPGAQFSIGGSNGAGGLGSSAGHYCCRPSQQHTRLPPSLSLHVVPAKQSPHSV